MVRALDSCLHGSRSMEVSSTIPTAPLIQKVAVETTGYFYSSVGPQAIAPAPTLVGLHGYAQTAADFLEVVKKWVPEDWVSASAQGSNQLWDRNTKQISFSWLTAFEKADTIAQNN